jgi:LemA protein
MKGNGLIIFGVALAVIVGIALICILYSISTKNSFISMREDINKQQANVEVALQRRADLIPNLVATVKGYATHEEKVFTEIAQARSKLAGSINSGNLSEISAANDELSSALSRLLVLKESYPELKANENFIALQDELAGTENRIAIARRDYNDLVSKYNTKIQRFPASIIANSNGFKSIDYFKSQEGANIAPNVDFSN